MGRDLAVEDENLAVGEAPAEMVVGAPVAEPELQHHAVQPRDPRRRHVEAGALRLDAADHQLQAARHGSSCPTRSLARTAAFMRRDERRGAPRLPAAPLPPVPRPDSDLDTGLTAGGRAVRSRRRWATAGRAAMAKANSILIKLVSSAGTGFYYTARKNPRTQADKLSLRKYDPVARKHVVFKEAKIK